jgi:hypothetical protein
MDRASVYGTEGCPFEPGGVYLKSDFIADCLEQWWGTNLDRFAHIRQLVINLDNGPQNANCRSCCVGNWTSPANAGGNDSLVSISVFCPGKPVSFMSPHADSFYRNSPRRRR